MTNFSSVFASASAEEILKLANSIDTSEMDTFELQEFNEAFATLKEKMRIDREYTEDLPALDAKTTREAPEHTLKDASHVGCTCLVDDAFVVNPMGEEDPDDRDVIVAAANNIVDDDDEVVVQQGFRGDPDDGSHQIILVDYPQKQEGKNGNGDYRVLRLRDVELCNEWTLVVGEADVAKRLQEISYNNKGALAGMTKKQCFGWMMSQTKGFPCWTVKNLKGKVVTYFDESAYTKYFRWVQSQKAAKEDAYAQKHSKEVTADEKAVTWAF